MTLEPWVGCWWFQSSSQWSYCCSVEQQEQVRRSAGSLLSSVSRPHSSSLQRLASAMTVRMASWKLGHCMCSFAPDSWSVWCARTHGSPYGAPHSARARPGPRALRSSHVFRGYRRGPTDRVGLWRIRVRMDLRLGRGDQLIVLASRRPATLGVHVAWKCGARFSQACEDRTAQSSPSSQAAGTMTSFRLWMCLQDRLRRA